jgi:Flp pilus assembly protein TadG
MRFHRTHPRPGTAAHAGVRRRGEQGQMVPLVALFFVVLIGSMAIATDLSVSTHYKRNLQNVTDAAALGGAKLLPISPGAADEQAATAAALGLVHNSFPWTPAGVSWSGTAWSSTLGGCSGGQCSVTVCAGGMTSASPPCTVNVSAPSGTQFVLTVNAPPLTASVASYNSPSDLHYRDRIEVVMHQKSGAFFTGIFGSSLDQDGAQSVAYHFAANQPFPFALFSSTVIGDGNSPEVIDGNVYAARYLAPQGNGHAAICAAPYVDSAGFSHQGYIVLGAPQGPDAGYANDGQSSNPKVPPGADPISTGIGNCASIGAGYVGMTASPGSTAGCQGAYPGNNGGANIVWDWTDQACEANPAITPPTVATPPNIPVYGGGQTFCGTGGLSGNVYQPGDYKCPSGTSLTIDHQMAPGIYEIESVSNSGCDVVMNGSTPTTLSSSSTNGVTFYLKGGAGICANPPSGTTINQTPYYAGTKLAGDGRYAVLSDNVGNPTITMNTAGGGSASGIWSVTGVIWLPTGTVNISNKDALQDSGQIIVNTWNDTSGYHENPSVSYNGDYAPAQPETLQLVG